MQIPTAGLFCFILQILFDLVYDIRAEIASVTFIEQDRVGEVILRSCAQALCNSRQSSFLPPCCSSVKSFIRKMI